MNGFKKIVEILRNADQSKYVTGLMHKVKVAGEYTGKDQYCSVGIVAKELGYEFTPDENLPMGECLEFVSEKLDVPYSDVERIMTWNDEHCDFYTCVADLVEDVLINGNDDADPAQENDDDWEDDEYYDEDEEDEEDEDDTDDKKQ